MLFRSVTIAELAGLVREVTGYAGRIVYDRDKPDGTPRKCMDVGRLARLGWTARTPLPEGLRRAYAEFMLSLDPAAADPA